MNTEFTNIELEQAVKASLEQATVEAVERSVRSALVDAETLIRQRVSMFATALMRKSTVKYQGRRLIIEIDFAEPGKLAGFQKV